MINENRLLQTFIELIKIYSPSRHERDVADYIIDHVKRCGYVAHEDSAGKAIDGDAGNLTVTIPGNADGPSIMFSAHMDTVEPGHGIEPHIENGIVTSKGETILGADDKAGCAAMLELMTVLSEHDIKHSTVHLVFTIAEEIGLLGAKNFDAGGLRIDYSYILDAHGSVGTIITAAPYQDSFEVTFFGKSAHAGVEPENGINAIQAASKAISIMRLGRIDDETTANIGMIQGGRAGNIVPDEVSVNGECRSLDKEKLEAHSNHIIECFKQGAREVGAEVIIKRSRPYNGFSVPADSPIVEALAQACKSLNIEVTLMTTGGGSDANVFAENGISTVNISIGFEEVHTDKERQPIKDLNDLTKLMLKMVEA